MIITCPFLLKLFLIWFLIGLVVGLIVGKIFSTLKKEQS